MTNSKTSFGVGSRCAALAIRAIPTTNEKRYSAYNSWIGLPAGEKRLKLLFISLGDIGKSRKTSKRGF